MNHLRESLIKNKILWLEHASYESSSADTVTLSFNSNFYLSMFKKQLLAEAQNTLSEFAGKPMKIDCIVKVHDETADAQSEKKDEASPAFTAPETAVKTETKRKLKTTSRRTGTIPP